MPYLGNVCSQDMVIAIVDSDWQVQWLEVTNSAAAAALCSILQGPKGKGCLSLNTGRQVFSGKIDVILHHFLLIEQWFWNEK